MTPVIRYTLARLGLFLVAFALVWGVCLLLGYRWTSITALWTALIALSVSAVASFALLGNLRNEVAARVQVRAERMTERIEESRRAEDLD
ncbi:DUF4229 domain-containing protein [Solicola sp. PLA-1-18]|uniref:DUF4229 domain-containing protein n=1 Tax=Solicola sp. PLA-1-18 TaxID=3380532 RepID=UPI003B7B621D